MVILTILDGWGYSKEKQGNAIANAKLPAISFIEQNYPSFLLQAAGQSVGLTWGESGNSEVGHLTIGAGRVIFQYLSRINRAIKTGTFFTNPVFIEAAEHVRRHNSRLHFAGLLTSNSVHSYLDHIVALIEFAKQQNLPAVFLHLFTDGKDSGLKEAPEILKKLEEYITASGITKLATVIGRDLAMDRNNNWDRTRTAYELIVNGTGEVAADIHAKLQEKYSQGLTDINMPPLLVDPGGLIRENDAVIFFNFREDRMRQLIKVFVTDFKEFPIQLPANLYIAGMSQYIDDAPLLHAAFPQPIIENGLSETISKSGVKQLHIAETEKYAHVTYFFNGLKNEPFAGEEDLLIKSDRDPADDPKMKAAEITAAAINAIQSGKYDFILINYANPDMLAHYGNLEKVIQGIEAMDPNIEKLRQAVLAKDGFLIITSDHGNAEAMTYRGSGEAETKHNPNPVPVYFISHQLEQPQDEQKIVASRGEPKGILSDVAPTVLDLLGIQKPVEMTGENLLKLLN